MREKSLKQKQYVKSLTKGKQLQEPTATHCGRKSRMLSSFVEENSTQVESLTCWICPEEFSSEACIVQHYDDHMRKPTLT